MDEVITGKFKIGGDILAKTEVTKQLEDAIFRETRKQGTFGCFEVTIGWYGNERVDYMTYNTKGEWRCYEIKCSKSDFHSKAKKTFVGHYNYYVMTKELYEEVKHEIPPHIGVYTYGALVKRPKRQELSVDEQVLKDSFIRSLYRDVEKLYDAGNESIINNFKRKISRLESEVKSLRSRQVEISNLLFRKLGRRWEDKLEEMKDII